MAFGRKSGSVAALALATTLLSAGSALAVPNTIDGISFGSNAVIESLDIWENTVAVPGDTLTGIGKVLNIKGTVAACGVTTICWTNGDNGRELTFSFTYKLEKITALDANTAEAWFSGGIANFYSDSSPDFSLNLGQAADFANATDGNLWLDLIGGPSGTVCAALDLCFDGAGTVITLVSTFDFLGTFADVLAGSGVGFLNVGGGLGLADSFMDTNTKPLGNDFLLNSDFAEDETGTDFPLSGTADLRGIARVPEPSTLALLGAGLLGLGWMRRRRKART